MRGMALRGFCERAVRAIRAVVDAICCHALLSLPCPDCPVKQAVNRPTKPFGALSNCLGSPSTGFAVLSRKGSKTAPIKPLVATNCEREKQR